MVIYEVNLTIDSDIYSEFTSWLQEHVTAMLQFPGFIQASILKPELDDTFGQEKLTIQYQLEHQNDLDRYVTEFAPKMREAGLKRFQDKFLATRRIFTVQAVVLK